MKMNSKTLGEILNRTWFRE